MTFRGRLRLFFTIIVIVPMIAVALVLFTLTAESETGKADAAIAAGLRNAFSVYEGDRDAARPVLRRVGTDASLRTALLTRQPPQARARLRGLLKQHPQARAIGLYSADGSLVTRVGSRNAIAPATAPLAGDGGGRLATLTVSTTSATSFVREVSGLSGQEVAVFRGGRPIASTVRGIEASRDSGSGEESRNFKVGGKEFRGRFDRIRQPVGPPVEVAVFKPASELTNAISSSRLVIGAILFAFLVLALATSVFVVRALQGQIGKFLDAAKSLARGDFKQRVPTEGNDEFAALGREFNSMSEQLAAMLEEVERKREELEETIRRVGEAFASGLDRQGAVELVVATAVDACDAEAGQVVPLDGQTFEASRSGSDAPELTAALEAAEREAFRIGGADGGRRKPQRRSAEGTAEGAYALAVPMRAQLGSRNAPEHIGVVSIARRGEEFSKQDREVLEYLAGQAVVSIENTDLHETVQRQAVTDELTGLSNVRELHTTLDREIERSRRFASALGLIMVDLDDFKQVNDEFGHQQGDVVLESVAQVLRQVSRDIDEPARYGGEELAVVLPETEADGAENLAERMREAIEALRIPRMGGGSPLAITASFGVASVPANADDKSSLIAAADAALYRAKRAGKNRVERAEPVAASR